MKITEIREINDVVLPDEWRNQETPLSPKAIARKSQSLDHQADLMMSKLEKWTEVAKGKVFTTTGVKSGMKIPKQVEANPRQYLAWTLVHSEANLVTKVYCDKDDIAVVRPVRKLIDRHNTLTNQRAELEGQLNKLRTTSGGAR